MKPQAIEAANRLADVLAQENAALMRMDFAGAIALLPAKEIALAELAREAPVAQSPAVLALARRLTGLAEENRTLLERAIAVQTRIVGIIARAITPLREGPRYHSPNERRTPYRAMAVAVSQRV